MKISPCQRNSWNHCGFTLIELLTVIAIIAILMGLLFPAIGAVKETARKTQAKNDATQIINAVKAYYTEYGKYPVPAFAGANSAEPVAADDAAHTAIMDALRVPDPTVTYALNPRRIVFLEVPTAKSATAPRGGIGPSPNNRFYDPWGGAYRIKIDANYDNVIVNPYTADTGAGPANINTGTIAWALGKNGLGGSGTKTGADSDDDVISWQ